MHTISAMDYGYDYDFIPELPDEYICVICHLALRNPKQIEECGHRFCEACLNAVKNLRSGLHCPIDREAFREDQVYKDKATGRAILNWKVKCPKHENGCKWNGELNTLKKHEKNCIFDKQEQLCNGNEEVKRKLKRELEESNDELLQVQNKIARLTNELEDLSPVKKTSEVITPKKQSKKQYTHLSQYTMSCFMDCYTWKCPIFKDREFHACRLSPKMYYKKYCFQVNLFSFGEKVAVQLFRCRGIFDELSMEINDMIAHQYRFIISLEAENKSIKNFIVTSKRKWTIKAHCFISSESSVIKLINITDYPDYTKNGFYHFICRFETA